MSDMILLSVVQTALSHPLHNVRNTFIVLGNNFHNGMVRLAVPIASLKRLNLGQTVIKANTSLADAQNYWQHRHPLFEDPQHHGDGNSFIAIIDGYISAVEEVSVEADHYLNNLAHQGGYSLNVIRRIVGLEAGMDAYTYLDQGMPSVTMTSILNEGRTALSEAVGYIMARYNATFVQPSLVPPPNDSTPAPSTPSSSYPHEADTLARKYLQFEISAMGALQIWADKLEGHQIGFIHRLDEIGKYRVQYYIDNNHENQAQMYRDIEHQYHDQTLLNVATQQVNPHAHPAISIVEIHNDDGTTGILVRLAGVDGQTGYDGANVLLPGAVVAGAGFETQYAKDIQNAIHDYFTRHPDLNEQSTPITLAGHSYGGIVAQQLADTNSDFGSHHNIHEVIAFGSPNMLSTYNQYTTVKLYTNVGDPVPLLSPPDLVKTESTSPIDYALDPTDARRFDTNGETVVDGGTSINLGANHGAYGDSTQLQHTSVDFTIPDPGSTYYYTAPSGDGPQQVYVTPPSQ